MHLAKEDFGLSVAFFLVGMGEEVPLSVKLIGGVVSYSEKLAVGTDEGVASAFFHRSSLLVNIGSCDLLASAYNGAVGAALSAAAVVETDEKVVVFAVANDERCFDSIVARFDCVVAFDGVVCDVVNFGEGDFSAHTP